MSIKVEVRQVERQVDVYRCDRLGCTAEALGMNAVGWMMCALMEKIPDPMTGRLILGSLNSGAMQVVCPECTKTLVAAMNNGAIVSPAQSERIQRILAGDVRYVDATLDTDEKVAELVARDRAQMSTILHTIGGTVEGQPTLAINYLQRLRQLVDIEREHERCKILGVARAG